MHSISDDTRNLIKAMCGRFGGEERFSTAAGEATAAEGSFETAGALGGRGLHSAYSQMTGGKNTLNSHSVFRFDKDDGVVMVWTPSSGDPVTFTGIHKDRILDLTAPDGDGVIRSRMDYSQDGEMHARMSIEARGEDAVPVFSATYRQLPPTAGRQVWRDLTVDNADEVRAFYEQVLGWRAEPVDMGDHEDFNMLDHAGDVAAGVCHALGSNADLPPLWLLYFQVDSLDAAIDAAGNNGGRIVVPPKAFGGFRYAVLADPADAQFVACEGSAF